MKALGERVRELLAKIDHRMEQQALREGADEPHVVACFGAFESLAGHLEQDLAQHEQGSRLPVLTVRLVAMRLRMLRRVARDHQLMVRIAARKIAPQQPKLELRVQPIKRSFPRRHC